MSDDEYTIGQAGFTVKQGSVTLVSASGRYKRKILGNLEPQATTMPSIWRKHMVGQIPTVPTGLRTENKKQLASIGIHRAIQAGIDGSVDLQKVFSIVMSGEYGEDEDRGDEVVYTGSGGRDASGTQTFDQTLDRRNLLLAQCCAAQLDATNGADAGDNWQQGVPIRVVRGAGVARHDDASYCPSEGYRYDGIYKVREYWPSTGYSGHRVWRYILKRDDRSPAPYTSEDKYVMDGVYGKANMAMDPLRRAMVQKLVPRIFNDNDMAKRNMYFSNFRALLALWRVHPRYWEGVEIPYPKARGRLDAAEFNEDLKIPENLTYMPTKKLLRAIQNDRMNMRVWRRLLSRKYQVEANIHDFMSFCEVSLTQLELQCLLCRSKQQIKAPLDIPLVNQSYMHCLKCDYNVCQACYKVSKSRGIKACPNCLTKSTLFASETLGDVYAAMNIVPRHQ